MRKGRWDSAAFLVALSMVVLGLLHGCGGSSDSGGSSSAVSVVGRVAGFAFSAPDGKSNIVLGNDATPPTGSVPLKNATIAISNTSVAGAVTDSTGHFVLSNVPAGYRTLRITPSGGSAVDFPITVFGGTTIALGTPKVSRATAVDVVKQALTAQNVALDTVTILAPSNPLPANTTVAPTLGDRFGDISDALNIRSHRPQWFVYVDLEPGFRFHHATRYYFVDTETGSLTSRDATSWPSINGLEFYRFKQVNARIPDLVSAATRSIVSRAPSIASQIAVGLSHDPSADLSDACRGTGSTDGKVVTRDHVPGCTDPKIYALLIQGSEEEELAQDRANIRRLFLGMKGTPVVSEYVGPSATARQDIIAKFNALCKQTTPCDTLFVYITGHAPEDGARITLSLVAGADPVNPKPGTTVALLPQDLDFTKCAACHVVVIIDTCYSGGRFANDTRKTLLAKKGMKATVITATDARQKARYDSDGGYMTKALSDASEQIRQSAGQGNFTLKDVFRQMETVAKVKERNPQLWVKPLAPGETCDATSTYGKTNYAIQLSFTITLPDPENGSQTFKQGTIISLRRITGYYHISGPDVGCDSVHLHGDPGSTGIYIDDLGPIPDPLPQSCGYGKITEILR